MDKGICNIINNNKCDKYKQMSYILFYTSTKQEQILLQESYHILLSDSILLLTL